MFINIFVKVFDFSCRLVYRSFGRVVVVGCLIRNIALTVCDACFTVMTVATVDATTITTTTAATATTADDDDASNCGGFVGRDDNNICVFLFLKYKNIEHPFSSEN